MKITREFESLKSWNEEIDKYKKGKPIDIYARHSYPALEKREHEIAEMIGTPDTVLFNAGMAAIHTAIEAEELHPGEIVLCGNNTYSQTKKLFEDLKRRGIRVIPIQSENTEEIKKAIAIYKPRLIIIESVSNAQSMGVANFKELGEEIEKTNNEYENLKPEKLLESMIEKRLSQLEEKELVEFKAKLLEEIDEFLEGQNPFVFRPSIKILRDQEMELQEAIEKVAWLVKYIIKNSREKLSIIVDNTLPSPVLYNPLRDVKGMDLKMVVVESATKHYQAGQDQITAGIAYSNKEDSLKRIKDKRVRLGTYLQPVSEQKIPENITETMPDIVQRHADNALTLAKFFNELASAKVGGILEVSHPNLPTHAQNELVNKIAPDGLVTLFYLKIKNASEFVKKIKEKAEDKIGIGASFGHPKTWIELLPDDPEGVRIAAGSETQKELNQLLEVIKNALT
ncbi:MAG: PLP-dependent transferase [Patescibacteria group bacterium]